MIDDIPAIIADDLNVFASEFCGICPQRLGHLGRTLYRNSAATFGRAMEHIDPESARKVYQRFVFHDKRLVIIGQAVRCRLLAG